MATDATNWQTPAALLIVSITFAIFCWKYFKKRRSRSQKAGCGAGCCSTPVAKPERKQPPIS